MKEILNAKLKEYQDSSFENKEFKTWLRNSDLWMAIYTCLRIRGIEMDKRELVDVVEGKIKENLPMEIYSFVSAFKDLYKEMQASIGMMQSLDEKLLNQFHEILYEECYTRRSNPIIYKWGYIAPHFNEISKAISDLSKNLERCDNPIERAIMAHEEIIKIYPYDEGTDVIATIAMYYELMRSNVPLPSFTVDDLDYNKLIASFLEGGNELEEMLIRSLLNRLDSVMMFGNESINK